MKKRLIITILLALTAGLHAQRWVVTQGGDSGAGSLREALELAAGHAGADTIAFAIPETDSSFTGSFWRIQPLTVYVNISGDSLFIDGASQAAFAGNNYAEGPAIWLDGSRLTDGHYGLSLTGQSCTLFDLALTGFDAYAVSIWGAASFEHSVRGCYIGSCSEGDSMVTNAIGIYLSSGSHDNEIRGNVLAGNSGDAIFISASHNNVLAANHIGLAADGMTPAGNGGEGIDIRDASSGNAIGGTEAVDGNVIVFNAGSGVALRHSGTRNNTVMGNDIGFLRDDMTPAGNGLWGVLCFSGAAANTIGVEDHGNWIASSGIDGVALRGAGTDSNQVAYNIIGAWGQADVLGNEASGIRVYDGAADNLLGPENRIMENDTYGIWIDGAGSVRNTITQNSIHFNEGEGIWLSNGANNVMAAPVLSESSAGRGTAAPYAVIEYFSDHDDEGRVYEGQTQADAGGSFAFDKTMRGPAITATATDAEGNTSVFSSPFWIGGLLVTHGGDEGEGSLRWALFQANDTAGPDTIRFDIPTDDPSFNGRVWTLSPLYNLPVLTGDSTVVWGRSQREHWGDFNTAGPEIVLDGALSSEGNGFSITGAHNRVDHITISNFSLYGIAVFGDTARFNTVTGCYIGTTPDGLGAAGMSKGVLIYDGAARNTVGGSTEDARNIISGNLNDGIHIDSADSNLVVGNYIGTTPDGLSANGNGQGGLGDAVDIRNGAQYNIIGGTSSGERNILSGNASVGLRMHGDSTSYNVGLGNWIGLNAQGTAALPNELFGVFVHESAPYNTIGGLEQGAGNVISGNADSGLELRDAGVEGNAVQGNLIGLTPDGGAPMPNGGNGVLIQEGAADNVIGPSNVISGNALNGVALEDSATCYNRIGGNYIGLNASGADTLGNGAWGLFVSDGASFNSFGTEELGRNVITGNRMGGVAVLDSITTELVFEGNWVGCSPNGLTASGNHGHGFTLGGRHHTLSGNLVAASTGHGVYFAPDSRGITLTANRIGTNIAGRDMGNGGDGLYFAPGAAGHSIGPDNFIWHNSGWGASLADSTVTGIEITANSIWDNGLGGLSMDHQANGAVDPPEVITMSPFAGTVAAGARVECFADSSGQGRSYLGFVNADESGQWVWPDEMSVPAVTLTAVLPEHGGTSVFSPVIRLASTAVEPEAELPRDFALEQNYPNPFNPRTQIHYTLPRTCRVKLVIFNLLGRRVAELVSEEQSAGRYSVDFDAADLPSGVYFCRLETNHFSAMKKMILLE